MSKIDMVIDSFRILDSIDQYVYCKNKSGIYIYANEQFSNIAGYNNKEDIIGKTDWDLIWKSDAKIYEESDRLVLEGSDYIKNENIQKRKNGTTKIILTKKKLYSNSGELLGIIGNFFDFNDTLILKTKGCFDEKKKRLYLSISPNKWLSYSEINICFYIIHGFSAPKISEKTKISISTVRFHIENIKEKMGCDNKNDIIEIAMKTGIAWKIINLQHIGNLKNDK